VDPTYREAVSEGGRKSQWSIDYSSSDDDIDSGALAGEASASRPASPSELIDRLIDASLDKIHQLQTASKKDEHRRVLVVNTLHRLLMVKMETLQAELALEELSCVEQNLRDDAMNSNKPRPTPRQEAASLLNRILQEKIGYLGYNRTVKIWVEPPKTASANAIISVPPKGARKGKAHAVAAAAGAKEEYRHESNAPDPSTRGAPMVL